MLHTACGITGALSTEIERDVAKVDFGDRQGQTYAARSRKAMPTATRNSGRARHHAPARRRKLRRRDDARLPAPWSAARRSIPYADIVVVGHGGSISRRLSLCFGIGARHAHSRCRSIPCR